MESCFVKFLAAHYNFCIRPLVANIYIEILVGDVRTADSASSVSLIVHHVVDSNTINSFLMSQLITFNFVTDYIRL